MCSLAEHVLPDKSEMNRNKVSSRCMQWLQRFATDGSDAHPMNGSVVQRLQRFATYGSLKQQVLRIITDELAIGSEQGQDALKKVLFGFIICCFVGFLLFTVRHVAILGASKRGLPNCVT
jgi:hypothetical protein